MYHNIAPSIKYHSAAYCGIVRTIPQPGAEYELLVREIHLGDAEDKPVLAETDYKSIMFHHCYQITGSVNFDGLNPIRPIHDVYRFAC